MSRVSNVDIYDNIDRMLSPRMERVGHHIGGVTAKRQKDPNGNWVNAWTYSVPCKTCDWTHSSDDKDLVLHALVRHKWETFCLSNCTEQERAQHKPLCITEDAHPVHKEVLRLVCTCGWSRVAYRGVSPVFVADEALVLWHQQHVAGEEDNSDGDPMPFARRKRVRVQRPVFRNN